MGHKSPICHAVVEETQVVFPEVADYLDGGGSAGCIEGRRKKMVLCRTRNSALE
jgi:hypothetical protein